MVLDGWLGLLLLEDHNGTLTHTRIDRRQIFVHFNVWNLCDASARQFKPKLLHWGSQSDSRGDSAPDLEINQTAKLDNLTLISDLDQSQSVADGSLIRFALIISQWNYVNPLSLTWKQMRAVRVLIKPLATVAFSVCLGFFVCLFASLMPAACGECQTATVRR